MRGKRFRVTGFPVVMASLGMTVVSLGACVAAVPTDASAPSGRSASADADGENQVWQGPRLLVRLRDDVSLNPSLLDSLSRSSGLVLRQRFAISPNIHVLQSQDPLTDAALARALQQLRENPAVIYAEPDKSVSLPR